MKTNIFTKLLITYLVIILLTLFVVGIFLTQLFQNYFYNLRQRELMVKGKEIADILAAQLLGLQDLRVTNDLLFILDQFLDARIQAVDKSVLVLATVPGFEEMSLPFSPEELEQLLQGEAVAKRNYHAQTGEQLVIVAVPVVLPNDVAGAVFLSAPLRGIAQTLSQVQRLIFYAALLASVLAMLAGLYLSKTISLPLQQMNQAAMEVAKGNYRQQVKVTSSDEVGQLAQTFNHMALKLRQTIEALSQEKAKLENIMLCMNEGVIAIDRKGRILLANSQAQKLLQAQEQDLTGRKLVDLPADKEIGSLFFAVIARGEALSEEFATTGGRMLSVQVSPLRRRQQIWGAVGILQDVTEVHQIEQMRRDFVANVSHELRTPMTSIQGFVEAILDGVVTDEKSRNRYLQIILAETVRLNRLVSDLLDLSYLETGQLAWQLEPLNLLPLLTQAADKLQPQFRQQSLAFRLQVPDSLPPVLGNYDRIQQVLINLLSNAVAFTPSGGCITLSADDTGKQVRIAVTDTGPGIPQAEQHLVWQRFHKVDKARTRSLGGTGLGLPIVKQIVEAHGGSVGLKSTLGQGSTFYFTLNKIEAETERC
ncbi:MAG: cell wall metabolism sensor histidine kinase WalK [Firmicutes bacterium]|nr:cell wall metabolism sensor histidine kinase WalK [Bacillota bacterium]